MKKIYIILVVVFFSAVLVFYFASRNTYKKYQQIIEMPLYTELERSNNFEKFLTDLKQKKKVYLTDDETDALDIESLVKNGEPLVTTAGSYSYIAHYDNKRHCIDIFTFIIQPNIIKEPFNEPQYSSGQIVNENGIGIELTDTGTTILKVKNSVSAEFTVIDNLCVRYDKNNNLLQLQNTPGSITINSLIIDLFTKDSNIYPLTGTITTDDKGAEDNTELAAITSIASGNMPTNYTTSFPVESSAKYDGSVTKQAYWGASIYMGMSGRFYGQYYTNAFVNAEFISPTDTNQIFLACYIEYTV